MRITNALTALLALPASTLAAPQPQPIEAELVASPLDTRDTDNGFIADVSDLWKRKGGGGAGGKGGGGGGSSSSSGKGGSSSGSSSSGSSSSSSSGYVHPSQFRPVRSGESKNRDSGGESGRGDGVGVGSSTSVRSGMGGISADTKAKRFGVFAAAAAFAAISSSGRGSHRHSHTNKPSRGSSSSNIGGSTKTGSGVTPRFGGSYAGGAKAPYTAGGRSASGINPIFLGVGLGAGAGLLLASYHYPGYYPYGAYVYPYHNPYTFRNRTARNNATSTSSSSSATATPTAGARLMMRDDGVEQTKNVTCLCAAYSVCGCDDNGNSTFLDSIIGDGSYSSLNLSIVDVADINGTSTIVLNGTLPNGTTASGGTENANAAVRMGSLGGYWAMVVIVGSMAFLT